MNKDVTEYKVNVHAEPVDGLSMDKYEFECQFYVESNKTVTIKKEEPPLVGKFKVGIPTLNK